MSEVLPPSVVPLVPVLVVFVPWRSCWCVSCPYCQWCRRRRSGRCVISFTKAGGPVSSSISNKMTTAATAVSHLNLVSSRLYLLSSRCWRANFLLTELSPEPVLDVCFIAIIMPFCSDSSTFQKAPSNQCTNCYRIFSLLTAGSTCEA